MADDSQSYLQSGVGGGLGEGWLGPNYSSTVPAGGTEAPCPYARNTTIPCDVDSLTLIDMTDGQSVTVSSKDNAIDEETPEHIKSDLGSYDLVFERLADYENNATKPETEVQLRIDRKHHGTCPRAAHPFVTLTGPGADKKWTLKTPEKTKWLALPEANHSPVSKVLFHPFWFPVSQGVRELVVSYESCACRLGGEKVKNQFKGLVRIYPKDIYELKFTMPPWKSWKGKKEASADITGTTKTSSSKSSEVFGETQSEDSTETEKQSYSGTNLTTTTVGGRDGEDYTKLSQTKGTKDFADTDTRSESVTEGKGVKGVAGHEVTVTESSEDKGKLKLSRAVKLDLEVSLKKNDRELGITKIVEQVLNRILHVATLVKDAIEALKSLIPKVGWSIDFEMALMEGSITGSWGRRDTAEASGGSRYVAVDRFWDITFQVTLFSFKLTLMAGFEVELDGHWWEASLELVAKIEGSLSCEARIGYEYTSAEPGSKAPLDVVGKGKLGGYAKATLWGYHLVDLSVEIDGGLRFIAELTLSFEQAPSVSAHLKRLETDVNFTCSFKNGKERPATVKLFDGKDLWSGYLP